MPIRYKESEISFVDAEGDCWTYEFRAWINVEASLQGDLSEPWLTGTFNSISSIEIEEISLSCDDGYKPITDSLRALAEDLARDHIRETYND